VNDLRAQLARVGIRGRLARRIELELADHARCDPDAQLGDARMIADRFAVELRVPRTRRVTFHGFIALALTAGSLGVATVGADHAGGWPPVSGTRGLVASLGGLTMALAGQVALVAGLLALWRALLGPEGGDMRIVQRRIGVALAAGAVVVAGHAAQTAALQPFLPAWWAALALPALTVPLLALGASARELQGAVALTCGVPLARRSFPWPLVLATGGAAVLLVTVGSAFAEHSWNEGVTRGAFELVAFGGCFAALGRYLGLRY
jgi:hypothetical protein